LYVLIAGSDSFASFTTTKSVQTSTSISTDIEGGLGGSVELGIQNDQEVTTCLGFGVSICKQATDIEISASASVSLDVLGVNNHASTESKSHTFAQTVSTSKNPDYTNNGDGDLYLTVSGSITLSPAYDIRTKYVDKSPTDSTKICVAQAIPNISWKRDPQATLSWISGKDVKEITIKQLEFANQQIKTAVELEPSLWTKDTETRYNETSDAIVRWQQMLDRNERLKAEAVAWP
jgi:hypothetical protein